MFAFMPTFDIVLSKGLIEFGVVQEYEYAEQFIENSTANALKQ